MDELEGHAAAMAWDWDANDIDGNEDDTKLWVPITPQTLTIMTTEWDARINTPANPMIPPRQMWVYVV